MTRKMNKRKNKKHKFMGMIANCFLKLFYVLKNKKNKKNEENMFGALFVCSF